MRDAVVNSVVLRQDDLVWKRPGLSIVPKTTRVVPVAREVCLLDSGGLIDGYVAGIVRVDAEPVASAAVLFGVSAAGHVAVRLCGLGGSISEEIVTEALEGVFHACNAVAQARASCDAALCGKLVVVVFVVQDAAIGVVDPASLVVPAVGNAGGACCSASCCCSGGRQGFAWLGRWFGSLRCVWIRRLSGGRGCWG